MRTALAKTRLIVVCLLGIAGGLCIEGQTAKTGGTIPDNNFTRLTQEEITLILEDVRDSNPMLLKRLEEDPEMKRSQIESLRQLLAFASEAQRIGLATDSRNRDELQNIRSEVMAVNYDKHINKTKPAKGSFGYIPDTAVAAYWGEEAGSTLPASIKAERKAKFDRFLATKVSLLGTANPEMKDRVPTDEETKQAREFFAKIQIYADDYNKRSAALPLPLRQKTALHVKLQQAQFLARLYSETLGKQVAASDEEIAGYLKEHPELDVATKRARAQKILDRAKNGEDFAKLANEFTEDPGNKNQQDEQQGGMYQNVPKGTMVAPFEQAALSLNAGQIAPELVESEFGFHIIKLERKSTTSPETYDVRHILIATAVTDPSNPTARPVPVKEYARREIESQKEQKLIDQLVAANKISVPEDFVVPAVAVPEKPKPVAAPKKRPARKRT